MNALSGGPILPGAPAMHMAEGMPPGPGGPYMMSAQQSNMSMGYNPAPGPAPGQPGESLLSLDCSGSSVRSGGDKVFLTCNENIDMQKKSK